MVAMVSIALRTLLVVRLGHPGVSAWLHPLGAGVVVALALASWRAAATAQLIWKGRTYTLTGGEAA